MHDEVSDPVLIREGERLDELQPGDLRVLQKEHGFRFGMDAVLLADFARVRERDRVADFGTGTGILPLLLRARGKGAEYDAFELQPELADMASRTMRINGLLERVRVHALPVEEAERAVPRCTVDHIVCNPPYWRDGSALKSRDEAAQLARHQGEEGLDAWFRMAHLLLKGRGRMSVVYPAPRLLELTRAMEDARMTPKRLRLVYPRADRPAVLCLVECMKDARPMLTVEPPLIVYEDDGSETAELKRIYREG